MIKLFIALSVALLLLLAGAILLTISAIVAISGNDGSLLSYIGATCYAASLIISILCWGYGIKGR